MKAKAVNIFFIFLIAASFSCRHTQIIQQENLQDGRILKIETFTFRHKGERFKQISAIIWDNDKIVYTYNISTKCGCVGKVEHMPRIMHYSLSTSANVEVPLNETDKFIFKKFASLPQIETYCSKNLLDSAKGFIKNN